MKNILLALTFFPLMALCTDVTLPTEDILGEIHVISTHLAYDRFSDAANESRKALPLVQDWLNQATESHSSYGNMNKVLTGLTQLGAASEEKAFRVAFSVASEGIVNFLRADQELRKNWQLHFCPHVEGHYAYWVQPLTEKRMNPYYGQAMFSCGVKKPW